jgi:hypothetical protein
MALISDWEFDLLVVGTAPAREKVEKKKKEKQRKSLRGITSFYFFLFFYFYFFYTHIGKTKNKQTKLQSRDNKINPTSKSESSRGGIGKGNAANMRSGCGPTCH